MYNGCGRVVKGAGRKAKRMVLQCINGVGSNLQKDYNYNDEACRRIFRLTDKLHQIFLISLC